MISAILSATRSTTAAIVAGTAACGTGTGSGSGSLRTKIPLRQRLARSFLRQLRRFSFQPPSPSFHQSSPWRDWRQSLSRQSMSSPWRQSRQSMSSPLVTTAVTPVASSKSFVPAVANVVSSLLLGLFLLRRRRSSTSTSISESISTGLRLFERLLERRCRRLVGDTDTESETATKSRSIVCDGTELK